MKRFPFLLCPPSSLIPHVRVSGFVVIFKLPSTIGASTVVKLKMKNA
nr:MAG TPA: hypothetical protein [Caudoviricetes sp.]